MSGKIPFGIGRLGKINNIKVIGVTGYWDNDFDLISSKNLFDLILGVVNKPMTLSEAMNNVDDLLKFVGKNIYHIVRFSGGGSL